MSIVRSYTVWCDRAAIDLPAPEAGCFSWPGEQANGTAQARQIARQQGWKRVRPNEHAPAIDLCPNCASDYSARESTPREGSRS